MSETLIKTASVKVMRSYDYSHFEAAITIENDSGLEPAEIDEMRKTCQRLTDKAVEQFKTSKMEAAKNYDSAHKKAQFISSCDAILQKPEGDRTINEIAMLKLRDDKKWEESFGSHYDYDDDDKFSQF